MKKNSGFKTLLLYLVISAVAILGLVYALMSMSASKDETEYSTVMQYFDDLKVKEYEFDLNNGKLTYILKGETEKKTYTVPNVSLFVNEVLGGEDGSNYRRRYNAENSGEPLKYDLIPISDNSFWLNLLPTVLMIGVMIFFFIFMMRNAGVGKTANFGKV
ncbi:MAG: ATP-dependent zinc metalloprotease FtsH, partial [Ruminococcus sp.]|nr:ATP-dependent zinc metalloprotease FtsH [Ruminococcus sp.]